jgi:hypothetical protein
MNRAATIAVITCAVLLSAAPAVGFEAVDPGGGVLDSGSAAGRMPVVLQSGDFTFVESGDGTRIEMDAFGWLADPGKPLLPSRTLLFLLPPGARARSVEVTNAAPVRLPGTYRVVPAPQLLPAGGPSGAWASLAQDRRDWERVNRAAYARDNAYPGQIVKIVASGGLREYAYVAVSFTPLVYHPRSGRLYQHDIVEAIVHYSVPGGAEGAELEVEPGFGSRGCDAKAARLFENYDEIVPMYEALREMSRGRDETHDYIIITTAALQDAVLASDFVTWKGMLGHDVKLVLMSDPEIAGQPGADTAEQVRNFLRQYYGPWGIEYVLLAGDDTAIPMRYCFPDPTNLTHNPGSVSNPGGSVPTDYYYADLSLSDAESWDLDGDGYHGQYTEDAPDFLAEVAMGRIPTGVPAAITNALDKLVLFEQDTGTWKDSALHGGAVLFYENQDYMGIPYRDGATCLDEIESTIMSGWNISHYCEHDGLDPSDYGWPALTMSAFTADWRTDSYGVVNWAGHGSPDGAWRVVWTSDDGDGVFETDGSDGYYNAAFVGDWSTLEDDYPSIVFAVSCNVGYPEPNSSGNLGVDLMTKPGFGAGAGVVSASRVAAVSGDWPTYPGGAESICYEFNRFMIDGPSGPGLVGDALYDAKFYCFANYGWDHYLEYWNQFDYNLYGDPALDRRGVAMTDVEDDVSVGVVRRPVLMQNAPNPFRSPTEISYILPRDGHVTLDVFDVAGRKVATLLDEEQRAGTRRVQWDTRDSNSRPVASGVYFYRLTTEDGVVERRMVVLR